VDAATKYFTGIDLEYITQQVRQGRLFDRVS